MGPVSLEIVDPHVALVTLRRPETRNAIDVAVTAALSAIVARTEADPDIRVVILTGTGDEAFCAGANLKAVANGELAALFTKDGGLAGFTTAQRSKPWIAAVNGFAVAGGCELALSCDMIIAASHASFGLPEVKRGLIAAAGGVYRLPRALPSKIANELIATGQALSAASAHRWGLVNKVVPQADLIREAISLAREIASNAPVAVRESLALARAALDHDDGALMQLSAEALDRVMATADFQEGPRAFVEKRPARWMGR